MNKIKLFGSKKICSNKIFYYFFIFISLFSLDRISKVFALTKLEYNHIALFKGLNFYLTFNRGVSFGIFASDSIFLFYLLTAVIFFVITLFFLFTVSEFKDDVNIFWHIFILAGACSNILDRILYKGVVDFIDVYISSWHWPTFNLADIFIVLGILGILGGMYKNVYYSKN